MPLMLHMRRHQRFRLLVLVGLLVQPIASSRSLLKLDALCKNCRDTPPAVGNNVVVNGLQQGYGHKSEKACDGEAKCSHGVCLCVTAGMETGFFHPVVSSKTPDDVDGGLPAKREEVRREQDSTDFIHLALVTLPGADATHVRKLWETVTGIVSENALRQEVGSEYSERTHAFGRDCGGIKIEAKTAQEWNDGVMACTYAKRATGSYPTLVTSIVDMQTQRDIKSIMDKILAKDTIIVLLMRNPVDWFYESQINRGYHQDRQMGDLQSVLEGLNPEAAAFKREQVRQNFSLVVSENGKFFHDVKKGNQLTEDDLAKSYGIKPLKHHVNMKQYITAITTEEILEDPSLVGLTMAQIRENVGFTAEEPADKKLAARQMRELRHMDLRNLFNLGSEGVYQTSENDPKQREKARKKAKEEEDRKAKLKPKAKPLWLPTGDAPFAYYEFNPWLLQQWKPLMETIMDPFRWRMRMHYVLRYEDLHDDPVGTMHDFLITTGVARHLRLSNERIERLTKQVENTLRRTPGLRNSAAAGIGFTSVPSDVLMKDLRHHQQVLQSFGYTYYLEADPPERMNEVKRKQALYRAREREAAVVTQGDYGYDKDIVNHVRAAGDMVAYGASPAALIAQHIARMHKQSDPTIVTFYTVVIVTFFLYLLQRGVHYMANRPQSGRQQAWMNKLQHAASNLSNKIPDLSMSQLQHAATNLSNRIPDLNGIARGPNDAAPVFGLSGMPVFR